VQQPLKREEYRVSYLDSHVRSRFAYQIRSIRKSLGLSQQQFATKITKPQSVVARLENPDNGLVSVKTLLEIAHALDVALLVQFTSYSDYLQRSSDLSPSALEAKNIHREEADFVARKEAVQQSSVVVPATAQIYLSSFSVSGELAWAKPIKSSLPVQDPHHIAMSMQTTA